jgi:hypothetical protein
VDRAHQLRREPLKDRPTAEIVVIIFAVVSAAAFLAVVCALVVIEATHPERDTGSAQQAVGGVFTAFVGVVVGYVLGQRDGRHRPPETFPFPRRDGTPET